MQHKFLKSGAVALIAFGLSATTVGADPKPSIAITLDCQGEVVDVSVGGNGVWAAAHDLNSTLVGVPIAFGAFNGVFTPTGGTPVAFSDPPFAKKNVPRTRNLIVDCTYTASGTLEYGSFSGAGSVTLVVPRIH